MDLLHAMLLFIAWGGKVPCALKSLTKSHADNVAAGQLLVLYMLMNRQLQEGINSDAMAMLQTYVRHAGRLSLRSGSSGCIGRCCKIHKLKQATPTIAGLQVRPLCVSCMVLEC